MRRGSTSSRGTRGSAPTDYSCSLCSRSFKRPDHLARHERAHSNSRPFQCGKCGRGFGRRDILLRHSYHVHQEKQRRASTGDDGTAGGSGSRKRLANASSPSSSSPSSSPQASNGQDNTTVVVSESQFNASVVGEKTTRDADAQFEHISNMGESDLDSFLDRLLTSCSYSTFTEGLQHEPLGRHTRPTTRRHTFSGDRQMPALTFQQELLGPSPPVEQRTHHVSPGADIHFTTQSLSYLTQSAFDRLIQSYLRHCASILPFIHFPSLNASIHVLYGRTGHNSCVPGRFCAQWKRRPHRTLLLSILALGAACDRNIPLALEIYHKTRREILEWLTTLQRMGPNHPPPLELIQAFVNYISFGVTWGDKSIEDLTIGHAVSLRNLVDLAHLEKPEPAAMARTRFACAECGNSGGAEWLEWVLAEERKRTFMTYFALMSSSLTYLDTMTSMDWRGVKHRMPCSSQVWTADSPTAWASTMSKEPRQPLFRNKLESLFAGVHDGQEPVGDDSALSPGDGHRTITCGSDYSCFVLIAAIHREIWLKRAQNSLDIASMQVVLQRWQNIWLSLTPTSETDLLTPLLGCSLAMFDNSQLLLHLNFQEAKESLQSREYGRFCVTLPAFDLRLDSDSSGSPQTRDIFADTDRRTVFRNLALYSVNALELAFKANSRLETDNPELTLSPHAAMAIFYCIQLLASWMCFYANCLAQGLYDAMLDASSEVEQVEDAFLLHKILVFGQNRMARSTQELGMAEMPENLDQRACGQLASDLLMIHSRIFCSRGTWPGFRNLGDALKARSERIFEWL